MRSRKGTIVVAAAIGLLALLWRLTYLHQTANVALMTAADQGGAGVYDAALEVLGVAGLRWAQALVGTGACLALWGIGRAFCGATTGLVAALAAACYGPWVYAGALQSPEIWAIGFVLAAVLALTGKHASRGPAGLFMGLACGLAGQYLPVAAVFLWWGIRRTERAGVVAVIGGFLFGMLPMVGWAGDAWMSAFVPAAEWPLALYRFWRGGEWTLDADPYVAVDGTVLALLIWKRGLAFPFGLVAPLALLGLYSMLRQCRAAPQRAFIAWMALAALCGAVLWGGERLVAVPFLLLVAVHAAEGLWRERNGLWLRGGAVMGLMVLSNAGEDAWQQAATAAERYRRGQAYERLSMKANAIREYEKAVSTQVAPDGTLAALGGLYSENGEYVRAAAAYRRVLQRQPDDAETRAELARVYLLAERPREAVEEYQALREKTVEGERWLGALGDARLMAGDSEGALDAYEEVMDWAPDSTRVLYHMARLYETEGFQEEALEAYLNLRRDPAREVEAGWRAAALLVEKDQIAAAETLLDSVLAQEPDSQPALWILGRLLAVNGRYAEALPVFERLRDMDPEGYRAYFFLSKLYHRLERGEEAEMAFVKYQTLKRRAEVQQSMEEDLNTVLRQFGEMGE